MTDLTIKASAFQVIAVGTGAATGALLRLGLIWGTARVAAPLPWSTLIANIVGCFIAGLLCDRLSALTEPMRLLLVTGFLGGLTTMSGFALDTFNIIQGGQTAAAALYWLTNAVGSLLVFAFGLWLSRVF